MNWKFQSSCSGFFLQFFLSRIEIKLNFKCWLYLLCLNINFFFININFVKITFFTHFWAHCIFMNQTIIMVSFKMLICGLIKQFFFLISVLKFINNKLEYHFLIFFRILPFQSGISEQEELVMIPGQRPRTPDNHFDDLLPQLTQI